MNVMNMTKDQLEIIQVNDWDEDAVKAYLELGMGDDDLNDFEEAYQGYFPTDERFVQGLLEDTGDIPKDLPSYVYIDWEATTRDIMMDYSEEGGYYFRNF